MRGESITFSYLGGIADSGLGGIPLIPLGRWLLGLSVVLLAAGIFLGGKRKIALLEQVRFGSRRHWWNAQFGGLLFCGAAACLFYECVVQGADTLFHLPWPEEMDGSLVLILWLVHMETLVGAFGLLDITKFGRLAPAILFLLEVLTFVTGVFFRGLSKYMFGTWGMYVQSSRVRAVDGFSPAAVLVLEGTMLLVIWKMGAVLAERGSRG